MTTKYDIGEEVFVKGIVQRVAINDQGEVGYLIKLCTGAGNIMDTAFDQCEVYPVIKEESK